MASKKKLKIGCVLVASASVVACGGAVEGTPTPGDEEETNPINDPIDTGGPIGARPTGGNGGQTHTDGQGGVVVGVPDTTGGSGGWVGQPPTGGWGGVVGIGGYGGWGGTGGWGGSVEMGGAPGEQYLGGAGPVR